MIAPRLIVGTLSEAEPMRCNADGQWLLYDCRLNPVTGLGCIVPGSEGRFITGKTIAVKSAECLPDPGSSTLPGDRVISFTWQEIPPVGPCTSTGSTGACCVFTQECTQSAEYKCRPTGARIGGENQCLPSFLPVPYPQFDPVNHNYKVESITLQIPCRKDYCSTPP